MCSLGVVDAATTAGALLTHGQRREASSFKSYFKVQNLTFTLLRLKMEIQDTPHLFD